MVTGKTSMLPFRIASVLKELLRMAAQREHSSIANMVDVLIRKRCARARIRIPEQAHLFLGVDTPPINR